jgi:hypothetical protein
MYDSYSEDIIQCSCNDEIHLNNQLPVLTPSEQKEENKLMITLVLIFVIMLCLEISAKL